MSLPTDFLNISIDTAMLRPILLPLLVMMLSVAAETLVAQPPAYLSLGTTMQGTLSNGEEHRYPLRLDANRFVTGVVDQQTVDVVVKVIGPDGDIVGRFDGPGRGPEPFQFDAHAGGVYTIHVVPFQREEGEYAITIDRIEPIAVEPAKRVDQLMQAYSGDAMPGGVVGVIRNGRLVFSKAYGMANLSYGIPFSTSTLTNIGSVSKQFTAFAIALLEHRGELSLDDDVRTYIPELPDFGSTVTLRNLLNHTGGYRELFNTLPLTGWRGEDDLDRNAAISLVQSQPELQSEPGTEYNYNNTGYILLAEVVERVTGEKFPAWMQTNVFAPLGMNNTVIKSMRGQVIPNSAAGYTWGAGGVFRETSDLAASYGAGGIYTTVGDLAIWVDNFRNPRVGTPEVIYRMTQPGVLTTGDTIPYALGLAIGEYRGQRMVQHSGADVAHRAIVAYYPEIDGGVIVLSNNATFDVNMFAEITDLFFADQLEPIAEEEESSGPAADVAVAATTLQEYVGRYEVVGIGLVIDYTRQGDTLFAQATGQPRLQMRPLNDSTFEYIGVAASVTFHRGADGSVESATHLQGQALPLRRLSDKPLSAEELAAYTGRYFSQELEVVYMVSLVDDRLVMTHRRTDTVTLEHATGDSFKGSHMLLSSVEFERRFDGAVSGFTVSNGRTRGVRFVKLPGGRMEEAARRD